MLVGRSSEKLNSAAADLPDQSRVLIAAGDTASQEAADKIFKDAVSKFGQVDVLVNGAGAMNLGPVGQLGSSEWWENFVSCAYPTGSGLNIAI